MPLLSKASVCVLQTVAHTEITDIKTSMIPLATISYVMHMKSSFLPIADLQLPIPTDTRKILHKNDSVQ